MKDKGSLRVGDVGAHLEMEIWENGAGLDISAATAKTMDIEDPDGNVITKAAVFVTDGADFKMEYVTEDASILHTDGTWRRQVKFTMGTWTGKSTIYSFRVEPNLS